MSLFDDDAIDDDLDIDENDAPATVAAPAFLEPRLATELSGHESTEKQLIDWWQSGKMPHALILTGPAGIGKATLAFRLARFLLTNPNPPVDDMFGPAVIPETLSTPANTPVFQQVASGGHPDLMAIARTMDDKRGVMHGEILVNEVRAIPLFMRKTAGEGGWRVVIVDEADTLNRNAQNALLKILEEPPARAILILVAGAAGSLIPTIRSRARVLSLEAPSRETFIALMKKHRPDLSAADTELLATISACSPGRAVNLLDQGGMAAIRSVFSLFDELAKAPDSEMWTMAEKLSVRSTPDPLEGMLDLTTWVLHDRAHKAAQAEEGARLTITLKTLDALAAHRTACDKGNLDRRHLALGALRILQHGLKIAA